MEPLNPIDRPFDPEGGAADLDFQLLENYLDGELSPAEAHRVEQRLSSEPELSAALGRMSAEYALRRAAFRSLEPDGRAAVAMNESFLRAARRMDSAVSYRRPLRLGRIAGALAACVVVSFCAGWVGRGLTAQSQARTTAPGARPAAEKDPALEPSVYQVALTDERGNITAVQKFDKLEEAQAFAADVGRWQARQHQLRQDAPAAPAVISSGL